MRISTSSLLLLIGASIALTVAGASVLYFKPERLIGEPLLHFGLSAAQFLSAVLILRFSTITKTLFWRVIKFLFGIACIGVMFKILHWAGADIILPISLFGIALVYLIRFAKKSKKRLLDILKVLWIFSEFTIMPMILVHWIDRQFSYLPLLFFILTLLYFTVSENRLKLLIR